MKDLQNNLHLGAFIMLGLVAFTAGVLNSIVAEVALKVYYFYQTSICRKLYTESLGRIYSPQAFFLEQFVIATGGWR